MQCECFTKPINRKMRLGALAPLSSSLDQESRSLAAVFEDELRRRNTYPLSH